MTGVATTTRTSFRQLMRARQGWAWLTPPLVFVVIWLNSGRLAAIVAGLVGAGYLLLIQRRPAAGAAVLLLGVVFNSVALPVAYKIGIPGSVVQGLSFWKEGAVAGCLVAVLRQRSVRRPDKLDIAALAYVALGSLYLLFPHVFVTGGPGSTLTLYDRALGWRSDVLYVLAFVVFRHLHLGRAVVDRIFRRFVVVSSITAVIGIFEAIFSATWNHFAVADLGVTVYRHQVLHQQPSGQFNLKNIRTFEYLDGHRFVRIGSVLFDDIVVGFIFAIGLGIAAEIAARGRAPRWVWASMPILWVALLLTQTRSAIIAGALATVMALRHRVGKSLARRALLGRVLAVVLIGGSPVLLASGALNRFTEDAGSNATHQSSYDQAIRIMADYPLGRGLATAAGGGLLVEQQQNTVEDGPAVVTEDQYLQIGDQLGFVGLLAYVGALLLIVRRLLWRGADDPLALAPAAMGNAAIGVVVGAITTQPFVSIEVALIFWGLAGLAVSVVDDRLEADPNFDRVTHGDSHRDGSTTMRPSITT